MATRVASLAAALARCRKASKLSRGAILVGLSGGKDSLATLDIVCRSEAFDRVQCFAMYLVPGLECFETPVRAAAERHGVPVEFVPHWDLARLLQSAVLRHPSERAARIKRQALSTVERALEVKFGIAWSAMGYRAADSAARAMDARTCDGVQERVRRLWPIWNWTNLAVHHYLRIRRIPETPQLVPGQSSGVSLEPRTLLAIRDRFPQDYQRILEVFPFAEVQVRRAEAQGRAVALPELHGREASPPDDQESGLQPAEDRGEGTTEAHRDPRKAEAASAARVEQADG